MKESVPEWLNSFEEGESRYVEVKSQDDASNLIRQITAVSRRRTRVKNWKFVCSTHLTINVSDINDQSLVLRVLALGNVGKSFYKVNH